MSATSKRQTNMRQKPPAFSTEERVASDTLLGLSDGSKSLGVDAAGTAWLLRRSEATAQSEQRSLHYPPSAANCIEQEGHSHGQRRRKLNMWQIGHVGKKLLRSTRGSRDDYDSFQSQEQAVTSDNTENHQQRQEHQQQPSSKSTSLSLRIEAARLRKRVQELEVENQQLRKQCDSLGATIMRHHNTPPSRLTRAARAHTPPRATSGEVVRQHCWQSLQMHSSLGCKQCLQTLEEAAAFGLAEPVDIVSWDSIISTNEIASQRTLGETPSARSSDVANWSGW